MWFRKVYLLFLIFFATFWLALVVSVLHPGHGDVEHFLDLFIKYSVFFWRTVDSQDM